MVVTCYVILECIVTVGCHEVLAQRFSCAMPAWHVLVVLNEVHAGAKRGACSQV